MTRLRWKYTWMLLLARLLFTAEAALAWHHPLYLSGGGWWRMRMRIDVRNDEARPAVGEPVAVPIGRAAGQADLAGQAAQSIRVCNEQGTEMLWALSGPDGEPVTRGPIAAGSSLILPAECAAGKSAAYYVYFDNPAAGAVPDFLQAHLGLVNGDLEKGEGDVPVGWVHDAPDDKHKASWRTEQPQSGKRCLNTVVAAGAEPTWIATRQSGIHINGGAKYRMKAWVRAENVEGFAGWYIHVGNRANTMIISPMLNAGAGTYRWKEVAAEFTAPPEANLADLGTVLRGTGTAWFDNVRLECLEPESKLRAVAGPSERVKLQELGAEEPWPKPSAAGDGSWDRRVRVRVFNFAPEEISRCLVCIDGTLFEARLRGQLREDALRIVDRGKPIPHRVLGSQVLFAASAPAESIHTYRVYYRNEGAASQPAKSAEAFLLRGSYNLVKNPGFEESDARPAEWTADDQGAAHSGITFGLDDPRQPGLNRRCAKMHVPPTAPQSWRGWRQSVPVKPGRSYLLNAWVKCEDVVGGEVRVHAHCHTAEGKLSQHNAMMGVGPGIRGTTDWTLMSGLLTMPSDAASLQLHLTMQERGTLWHDNVVVAEVVRGELAGMEGRPVAHSDGVKLWPVPAVVKVFEDDPAPASAGPARVTAARNEQEPFQLAVRSGRAVRGVRVEVQPLEGPGGVKLEDVQISVVGYVPIDYPTNYYQTESPAWCRKFPTQPAACDGWAGRWPDPLMPRATFDLAANTTQPIWITVSVPKDGAAGDYTGKMRLVAEGHTLAEMPLALHVWNFALPDESHVGAIYDVGITDGGKAWQEPVDEVRWDIIRFMAKRRLCPDRVPVAPSIRYENGRVVADFAAFDRAAEVYFNELKLPFSYTPWEFYLFGWGFPPAERFGEHPYPGKPPYEGADRSKLRPEFKKAYQACLKSFWDHVGKKGWQDKFVLYISDEPFDGQAPIREQMKALCAMIHEVDPKIPIYSSTWKHVHEWDGFVNHWGFGHYGIVPPEVMAKRRAAGDRIWFTTDGQMCTDTPLCAVERLLPHYCFKYDVQSYEFWGVSWTTYDPFRFGWHAFIHQSDQPGKSYYVRYPNGDGYLLYPGPLAGHPGPVSSVRLEQAREGAEDYEYLYMLKSLIAKAKAAGKDTVQADQAMEQANRLVTIPNAGGRYSSKILSEPETLYRAKEAVATAIEGLGLFPANVMRIRMKYMKTIELSEVSALAPHVQPGSREPVILTQGGQAVAAVFPADEQDVENLLLSTNPQFQAILERSERRLESEGGISSAEVRRRLGLPARGPQT